MSSDLILRNGDMIHSVSDLLQISALLCKSKMLPNSIQSPEAAAAIILKGREIGMPIMESFSMINVIQGKPTISPQGMIALARRTRELEDLQIVDDGETCTVTVKRRGQSPFASSFSVQDARAMQLANKDNWQKQPKVMRQWRAIAANFRITFPDVIGGMYTPEELGASVNDEGEVIESVAVEITPAPSVDPVPSMDYLTPGGIDIPSHHEPEPEQAAATQEDFVKYVRENKVRNTEKVVKANTTNGQTNWSAALSQLRGATSPVG